MDIFDNVVQQHCKDHNITLNPAQQAVLTLLEATLKLRKEIWPDGMAMSDPISIYTGQRMGNTVLWSILQKVSKEPFYRVMQTSMAASRHEGCIGLLEFRAIAETLRAPATVVFEESGILGREPFRDALARKYPNETPRDLIVSLVQRGILVIMS